MISCTQPERGSAAYLAMHLLYIPPYTTTTPYISRLAAPVVAYKHHLQRAALAIS